MEVHDSDCADRRRINRIHDVCTTRKTGSLGSWEEATTWEGKDRRRFRANWHRGRLQDLINTFLSISMLVWFYSVIYIILWNQLYHINICIVSGKTSKKHRFLRKMASNLFWIYPLSRHLPWWVGKVSWGCKNAWYVIMTNWLILCFLFNFPCLSA